MISAFVNVILPVFIILVMGFTIGKLFYIENKTLSTLSLYLLTPCLMFQALYKYEHIFTITTLIIFGIITLIVVVTILLVELAGRVLKLNKSTRIVLILALILPNTGNFGLPINEFAYGEQAFLIASMVMVIYQFYTNTIGVFIAASDKEQPKKALISTLKIPLLYVMILALVINYFHVRLPKYIFKPIEMVGLSAIPINLLQVGINLAKIKLIRRKIPTILAATVIKLVLLPLLAYFLLLAFGIQGLEFKTTLTQIAMPSAVYSSILSSHYDTDSDLASSIVFVTTLTSLVTLSFLVSILR